MILQELLYRMMAELRDICETQGIPYFLTGWSALSAYGGGCLREDVQAGQIMIRVEDAQALADAVTAAIREGTVSDRAIEYLGNNPAFPGFFIRYSAENTTAFEPFHERGYTHYGVSVDILFAKHRPANYLIRKKLAIYEVGLLSRNGDQIDMPPQELEAGKTFVKFYKRRFRNNGEKLFHWMIRKYSNSNEIIECKVNHKPRFRYIGKKDIFDAYSIYKLGDEDFRLPLDAAAYISKLYKRHYKTLLAEGIKYPDMLINTELPYSELFKSMGVNAKEFIQDMEKIQNAHQDTYLSHSKDSAYVNSTWSAMGQYNDTLKLREVYSDEYIDEIEDALKYGDYAAAYEMLAPYLKHMDHNEVNKLKGPDYTISERMEAIIDRYDLRDQKSMQK